MKYYRGFKSNNNYFEGWFFKQDSENLNIAFIPSISIINKRVKKCYIQVISNTFSHTFEFPYSLFKAKKRTFYIEIGKNLFTSKGLSLDLKDSDYHIQVNLQYSPFQKLKSDIMGIFRYFPFMECRHKIFSMKHNVTGTIAINDKVYNFNQDHGYIEKDYGTSFPTNYIWLQCNNFQEASSFFFSYATIPYLGLKFNGIISSLIIDKKEYRFATYNFAKILKLEKNHIILKRKKRKLDIEYLSSSSNQLLAPEKGAMSSHIYESLNGKCEIKLFENKKLIYHGIGKNAGVESR